MWRVEGGQGGVLLPSERARLTTGRETIGFVHGFFVALGANSERGERGDTYLLLDILYPGTNVYFNYEFVLHTPAGSAW